MSEIDWYKEHRLEEAKFIKSIIESYWEFHELDARTTNIIRLLIVKRIKALESGKK